MTERKKEENFSQPQVELYQSNSQRLDVPAMQERTASRPPPPPHPDTSASLITKDFLSFLNSFVRSFFTFL